MTVAEVIHELSRLPADSLVLIADEYDGSHVLVKIHRIRQEAAVFVAQSQGDGFYLGRSALDFELDVQEYTRTEPAQVVIIIPRDNRNDYLLPGEGYQD